MLPNLILEIGLTAMLSIANTPYRTPDGGKKPAQFTYVLLEKRVADNFSIMFINSSRNDIRHGNEFNPQTTKWTVEAKYYTKIEENSTLVFGVGHTSEHEVGAKDELTESYDFAKISYRLEFN